MDGQTDGRMDMMQRLMQPSMGLHNNHTACLDQNVSR